MKSQQSKGSAGRSRSSSTTISTSKSLIRAMCRSQILFSASERTSIGRSRHSVRAVVNVEIRAACRGLPPQRSGKLPSPAHCKPLGKEPWQTGFTDFLLRGGEIVLCSQQFDEIVLDVVNTISSAPVSVARLANTARVDEIFLARLNTNVLGVVAPDAVIAHKYHRHMRVAEKTDGRPLIRKTRDGVEIVEYVAPLPGRIESGVHDGKVVYPLLQRQAAQPFPLRLVQAFARPPHRAFGELVETLRWRGERCVRIA